MKLLSLLATLMLSGISAAANPITETFTLSTSAAIPDGDLSGLVQTLTVSGTALDTIERVEISLQTTGGWNGDLFAYLWHDGVISVLMNRPGRTAVNLDGSPASGLNVVFRDDAAQDFHAAAGTGVLTGTWQPDQRSTHPLQTLDTDLRTLPLSVFNTTSPAGAWRLFIADTAAGDQATLTSWSVTLTGTSAIPEPASAATTLLGLAALMMRRKRVA